MAENNQQQFVQLVVEPEFQITITQPWRVRRTVDGFMPTISQSTDGYVQVRLNQHTYKLHRLVALQFITIDDPERKIQVHHVNHNRSDSSLTNLRWVTCSSNNLNKDQPYVDDIDDESIVVNDKITPPDRLNSDAKMEYLIAVDLKLKRKIDYERIRNFQIIRRGQYGTQPDVNKAIFGPDWKNMQQDPHLLKRIVSNDDVQQLLDEQQEQHLLMMGEVQNKKQKIVERNEGTPDPRISDIQSSLPPKIIPNRIARESDFNIDARLAEPSARTGSAAMPPDPDTLLKELPQK
ncbi:MAG: hypothetical protein EZS28_025763 [Streblomastix strix]|uniref:HNH nuclease domain-containing protein n=1 Tax=Streblomastix strix TaxID=222440 RepID=A0A5J4V895_9EUKA|nr:MAG: hypothetical protein EZS28_025763 [Streblomastix strix]